MLKFFVFVSLSLLLSQNSVSCAPATTDVSTTLATEKNEDGGNKEEAEMKIVVKKISELAKQIIQLMEPASNKGEATVKDSNENTYFLSFMFKDKKPSGNETTEANGRRMTVNNNFSATHINPAQTFVESGNSQKQVPSHNVQIKNNYGKTK